jgi:hypothetical protein
MRKIFAILLAVMLIASLAVSAYAVTPKWEYKAVKLPEIRVQPNFVEDIVANWFKQNPLQINFTSVKLG